MRERGYDLLGEQITTLGFPLTGLGSQLKSPARQYRGATRRGSDIRFMQFTAPIQPGSSGSPLLLPTGRSGRYGYPYHCQYPKHELCRQISIIICAFNFYGLNVSELTMILAKHPYPRLRLPNRVNLLCG